MLVLDFIFKLSVKVITLVLVNVEELVKAECPPKFYGSAGKESSEDSSGNTEKPKRLIVPSIINSTLPQREINLKTELFSLKLFSKKKPRRSKLISLRLNKTLEDKRI